MVKLPTKEEIQAEFKKVIRENEEKTKKKLLREAIWKKIIKLKSKNTKIR